MISKSLPAKKRPGLFNRLRGFLKKTGLSDPGSLEELEDILISSDAGVETTLKVINSLERAKAADLPSALREALLGIFGEKERSLNVSPSGLTVIMLTGVNGTGKTTTAGKLARHFRSRGEKVLLAAADTFRAGASEQLGIWAERAGAGIVHHKSGADPSAVVYDAVEASLSREIDVLIVDTAGRLHTRVNLMEELKKIKKVAAKKIPGAPHETMLVLDATSGQNALAQARMFSEAMDITSLALIKLDGTARGGIVLAIEDELSVPVKVVGVGEGIEDIGFFEPEKFVDGLLGMDRE